jgi:hypothetical protein
MGMGGPHSVGMKLQAAGQLLLAAGKCTEARSQLDAIARQMAVPLIQGALRYAYRLGAGLSGANQMKEWAEAWMFARGFLPQMHACSATAAALVRQNLDLASTSPMADGFVKVKQAMESVYGCMGLTCADVGEQLNVPAVPCSAGRLAGYVARSNVTQHARIDLDQRQIQTALAANDLALARTIYVEGANSQKTSGKRTLQGFSTGVAGTNKADYPLYVQFTKYYNSSKYADDLVLAALDKQGVFAGKPDVVLREAVQKGTAYGHSWMYVLLELEDAVDDCEAGTLYSNTYVDGNVMAWDEGWAFYAGSLEGPDGLGEGVQPYSLAEKRCEAFAQAGPSVSRPPEGPLDIWLLGGLKLVEVGRGDGWRFAPQASGCFFFPFCFHLSFINMHLYQWGPWVGWGGFTWGVLFGLSVVRPTSSNRQGFGGGRRSPKKFQIFFSWNFISKVL